MGHRRSFPAPMFFLRWCRVSRFRVLQLLRVFATVELLRMPAGPDYDGCCTIALSRLPHAADSTLNAVLRRRSQIRHPYLPRAPLVCSPLRSSHMKSTSLNASRLALALFRRLHPAVATVLRGPRSSGREASWDQKAKHAYDTTRSDTDSENGAGQQTPSQFDAPDADRSTQRIHRRSGLLSRCTYAKS